MLTAEVRITGHTFSEWLTMRVDPTATLSLVPEALASRLLMDRVGDRPFQLPGGEVIQLSARNVLIVCQGITTETVVAVFRDVFPVLGRNALDSLFLEVRGSGLVPVVGSLGTFPAQEPDWAAFGMLHLKHERAPY